MLLPKKISLVSQAVDILKGQIERGELSGSLPGERRMAEKLQIGRDTLRASLLELERIGWIGEGSQGRKRLILKEGERIEPKSKIGYQVGFLSPKNLQSESSQGQTELDCLRGLLEEHEVTMEVKSPAVFDMKRPSIRLREMLKAFPADLWVLYQCNERIQRWFEKEGIPCIVRGSLQGDVKLPQLGGDYFTVGYHAGNHLVRLGHREVVLMVPHHKLDDLDTVESGLRKALSFPGVNGELRVVEEKRTNDSVIEAVKEVLKSNGSPSIVLTRPRQVLTVMTWLATQGLQIPQDLSIMALCHEGWFDHLVPQVTHYQSSAESVAEMLASRIQSALEVGAGEQGVSMILPDLVKGDSVKDLRGS